MCKSVSVKPRIVTGQTHLPKELVNNKNRGGGGSLLVSLVVVSLVVVVRLVEPKPKTEKSQILVTLMAVAAVV